MVLLSIVLNIQRRDVVVHLFQTLIKLRFVFVELGDRDLELPINFFLVLQLVIN